MNEEGGGASRSTDPAFGSSSATDVSLREYLVAKIDAVEKRSDERFEEMKAAVATAFSESQKAITKAETATEKRFEAVNEFRQTLSDQAAAFITRDTLNSLTEKLEASISRNRQDLNELSKRIDLRQGELAGSKTTTGTFLAIGGLALTVVIVLIALLTHITFK
jgi:DNA anti-recombination protein RmuC